MDRENKPRRASAPAGRREGWTEDDPTAAGCDEAGAAGDNEIESPGEVTPTETEDPTELSQGEGDVKALLLIVGPEGLTTKIKQTMEAINDCGINIKATQQLKPENASHWKNEDVAYIVFVIDSSDPFGLQRVDDQLCYLDKNYVFAFDRINFLLAQEPDEGKAMIIKASDVALFMAKFGQPLINIVFNEGWQTDGNLNEQMRMFINRFQVLAGTSPDPDSNSNSSQSQSQ